MDRLFVSTEWILLAKVKLKETEKKIRLWYERLRCDSRFEWNKPILLKRPKFVVLWDLKGSHKLRFVSLNLALESVFHHLVSLRGYNGTHPFFWNLQNNHSKMLVFAHTWHMIKLLCYHYGGKELTLPSKNLIAKSSMQSVLVKNKREVQFKLEHLSLSVSDPITCVSGREKQRLLYAAQLFSRTTSKAVSYFFRILIYSNSNLN